MSPNYINLSTSHNKWELLMDVEVKNAYRLFIRDINSKQWVWYSNWMDRERLIKFINKCVGKHIHLYHAYNDGLRAHTKTRTDSTSYNRYERWFIKEIMCLNDSE